MGNDRGDTGFEWINAWAEASRPQAAAGNAETAVAAAASPAPKATVGPVRSAPALPADQLMRDIAEIEQVRDALALLPVAVPFSRRTQALTLVPPRTTDPVPVVIGGVLALVMLTVFGAAAAMSKFAR